MIKNILFLLTLLTLTNTSNAKGFVKEVESLNLDSAMFLAKHALNKCRELNFSTTVTVVGRRGEILVVLHDDGAFPHTLESSRRKAYTAASRKLPTSVISEDNKHEPSLGDLFNNIGMTTLSGGIPVYSKGQVVGAVGVAGAPGENSKGEEYDDICVKFAINKLK